MKSLFTLFSHWNVPPDLQSDLEQAEVIIVHEFGDQKTPSTTTRIAVEKALEMAKKYRQPLICQFPGNQVAEEGGISPIHIVRTHGQDTESYLDTDEVNRQVAKLCRQHGWKKVIFFTHPHHAWRVAENLKKHELAPLYPDLSGIPYDFKHPRWGLRSPALFVPREILARCLYKLRGRI